MKKMLQTIIYMLALSIVFHACSEDPASNDGDSDSTTAPTTYEFYDADENSTVVYSGQVVRNLLITDIKSLVSEDPSLLVGMYQNSEANQARSIASASGLSTVQTTYGDVSSSNLSGKIASTGDGYGIDDCVVAGYGMEPDVLVNAWFDAAASGSYSSDGLDIGQMTQKGLMGLVSYYQGTSKYLGLVLDKDNTTPGEGNFYTDMEHYWDESFGYFGASRTYNTLADDNARKSSSDTDGNGTIDYMTEYNFDWATYAAKRDIACATAGCTSDADFTGDIMGAYIEGRTLIHNEGALDDITAQRLIIQNSWEKLVAANVIHYANDVASKIESGSGILHSWAEMRAFSMALQYNSAKLISDSVLSDVITLMGVTPPAEADYTTYQTTLTGTDGVVSKLQEAYMFEDTNVNNW